MSPNMSRTVNRLGIKYSVKKVTQAVVNHRTVEIIENIIIKAVVQSASPTVLNVLDVDISLVYYQVHTTANVTDGDIIIIYGKDYRLTKGRDFRSYGYSEFVAEEIK